MRVRNHFPRVFYRMATYAIVSALNLVLFSLTGCGQPGQLYLPHTASVNVAPTPSASGLKTQTGKMQESNQ